MEQKFESGEKRLGRRLEPRPVRIRGETGAEIGAATLGGPNDSARDHGLRRKIKLKKLSLFYAGERDLSFDEEDGEDGGEKPESALGARCRLSRLTELTNKINRWDEDISYIRSKAKKRELKLLSEDPAEKRKQSTGDPILGDRGRILEGLKVAAGNDAAERFFPSLRNLETEKVNLSHPPDKDTSKPIGFSKEAPIYKLKESSDYSSADEDDGSEVYFSPVKLIKSSSFEYISNDVQTPLVHTISIYRRQQQERRVFSEEEKADTTTEGDSGSSLEEEVQKLLAEVDRQRVIRMQASQALDLCVSNAKFYGGKEQVEGERLLLLADHKRQACLNEIKRLKSENGLEPNENLIFKRGLVTVSEISFKLRREIFNAMAERPLHFVCLAKSGEHVLASPPVSAALVDLLDFRLSVPGSLHLETSFSNPTITIEIYSLSLNEGSLPDDSKCGKKENKFFSPVKRNKFERGWPDRRVQGSIGGRITNFSFSGCLTFALKETNQTDWNLDRLTPASPLQGTLSMSISSQMCLDGEFRTFLTVFDDISGSGVWHRRWCLLSSHYMLFWKYPDEEQSKVPLGMIDLRTVVTESVGRVPCDVCARLNTFLLESTRPYLKEDKNSLIMRVEEGLTTTRYLLSADSKPEMSSWCRKLNAILDFLKKVAS